MVGVEVVVEAVSGVLGGGGVKGRRRPTYASRNGAGCGGVEGRQGAGVLGGAGGTRRMKRL